MLGAGWDAGEGQGAAHPPPLAALRIVTVMNEGAGWGSSRCAWPGPLGLANLCKAAAEKMVTNSISEI